VPREESERAVMAFRLPRYFWLSGSSRRIAVGWP
jgi:hypothetical protein